MYYSTVIMDSSEKTRVRQYKKSPFPRLRWTPELHDQFVEVVHNLGGRYKATPKKIMQMMAVKELKISHIKSHLQMYRSMKTSNDIKGFIKSYQDNKLNCNSWLTLRKQIQGPLICQKRRKTAQNGEYVTSDEYQVEGIEGSTTSAVTKGSAEITGANMELQGNYEINFLGLSNPNHINLDLTM